MKKIINEFKASISKIEDLINLRDNYFECKTENWQLSIHGIEYNNETELLICVKEDLSISMNKLIMFMEQIN